MLEFSDTPKILYKFLVEDEKSRRIFINFSIASPWTAVSNMQNVTQLINSPNVAMKLESNSILQLDNPTTSKAQNFPNPTKKVLRKKGISKVSCSVEILSILQKASVEYHKIASKRYYSPSIFFINNYFISDTQLLKSDFHGAEIEVTKSKCFSLVGLKGIVVQETFSTFKIVKCSKSMKSKGN